MLIRDICPQCQSLKYKKNGHIHNGQPTYHGKAWGRLYVSCFAQDLVSDATRALIERLLVERISRRGISRLVGVTLKWLLGFRTGAGDRTPEIQEPSGCWPLKAHVTASTR